MARYTMRFGNGRCVNTAAVRKYLHNQLGRINPRLEVFVQLHGLQVEVEIGKEPWRLILTWQRQQAGLRIGKHLRDTINHFAGSLVDRSNLFVQECSTRLPQKSITVELRINDMGPFVVKDPDPDDGRDPHFHAFMD